MTATHISPYSGSWYPRAEGKLTSLLDEVFDRSHDRTGPCLLRNPLGFVVPHAAPRYSGTVAAAAYRHLIAAAPGRVFLLGFNHRQRREGVCMPDVERYATPAGEVAVDGAAVAELARRAPFRVWPETAACDHSIEIQLPFLSRAAPDARIVPLCVGTLTDGERADAAEAIARMWRRGDVMVASSDLTHYGRDFGFAPFAADEKTASRLRELDEGAIQAASSLDAALFLRMTDDPSASPCGSAPIALLLETLSRVAAEPVYQEELDYQTSGEITGDYTVSVSYASLGYFRRDAWEIDRSAGECLLAAAAAGLERFRATGRREPPPAAPHPALARRSGVFVTLSRAGQQLGCMGQIHGRLPLGEAVPELALGAALDDPRNEQPGCIPPDAELEIAVLTPMKLIRSAAQIEPGVDGAYVASGRHRAILLPRAARPEPTAADFVAAVCRKAGLRPGAEERGEARLFSFRAQVFSTVLAATSPERA